MQDFIHRFFQQLHAHQNDQNRDQRGRHVFHAPVAERMLRIGRLVGQLEAQQRHGVGPDIGKVVERVRQDGHTARKKADGNFDGKQ